jgi:hypothetical protein
MDEGAGPRLLQWLLNGAQAGVAQPAAARQVNYMLHDEGVATLLDEAAYHIQHLRLGVRGTIPDAAEQPPPGSSRRIGGPWPRRRQLDRPYTLRGY